MIDGPYTSKLDFLSERYEFAQWAEPGAGGEALFIRNFFLSERELPDLTALRIERLVDAEGRPGPIHSIWQAGEDSEALLNLVLTEAGSRAAARAALLEMLGDFQARLQPQAELGDIAFATASLGAVVFALGNVVALVRTAGAGIDAVGGYAQTLALLFRSRSERETRGGPEIKELAIGAEIAPGMTELTVRVVDPRSRPTWLKIFATGGEVLEYEGKLAFRATGDRPRRLEVVAVADDDASSSTVLNLENA
jgi:hypothetical protein